MATSRTSGDAALIASIKLKTLALWAGRLAAPLIAISLLFKAMDQRAAAVAIRVQQLGEMMRKGSVSAEELREKFE